MGEAVALEGLGSRASPPVGGTVAPATRHMTTLVVENMHCGGCIRTVERTLGEQADVVGARANLSTRRVTVETVGPLASEEKLVAALAAKGFKATRLADERPADEEERQRDFLRRLGVAGFAAANIMLMSVAVWSGQAQDMPASMMSLFHWLSALVAIPAVAYAGQPFFGSARRALAAGRLNMDVPISLGVLLATGMSLWQTAAGHHHVYFDAAVTLLFFLLIGRALDSRMRAQAASAAQNLLGARATAATIIHPDGRAERIATRAIEPGMRVLVAAGERVPIDARVASGHGAIDESLITGETRPRMVAGGDQLYAGTINLSAPIEAVATSAEDATLLAEIGRLMSAAEQAKSRYVRLADRAAQIYAPAVHVLGLATFLGWIGLGHGWEPALTAAIAVLIITCPCALALAVPVTQVVASGRLFRRGIIVKAADGLERLASIDTVVLDKTGTLTRGEPRIVDGGRIDDATLALAASLAIGSRHPYARAVVVAARDRGLAVAPAAGVTEVGGAGLIAEMDGHEVRLGSGRHCGITDADANAATLWLRIAGRQPLALHFADELRPDAREVVAALKARGLAVEILSGDRADAVAEAAGDVGITEWRAAQRPDEKIARIEALAARGRKVLMVGDGLNDAPALAAGHASLSPSTAADISQTAADAVFQGEALAPIIETLAVARASERRSLENLAIAVGYNILFVPLAMTGRLTPLIAAIAMSASSIAVTANALRVHWAKGGRTS
ncbi:MAG: heavy metal translocating P-type ATPase [Hyphomicrobiaceae bacterium]|nr:heavy metal translocating P-type ATPase [Hyphomicrobiaceae bacterium]